MGKVSVFMPTFSGSLPAPGASQSLERPARPERPRSRRASPRAVVGLRRPGRGIRGADAGPHAPAAGRAVRGADADPGGGAGQAGARRPRAIAASQLSPGSAPATAATPPGFQGVGQNEASRDRLCAVGRTVGTGGPVTATTEDAGAARPAE
ncbi:hypothetical protein GCM10020295_05190 [Streptomyces cinereospinus]